MGIYTWRSWGTKRLRDLTKVRQLVRVELWFELRQAASRVRAHNYYFLKDWTQGFFSSSSSFFPTGKTRIYFALWFVDGVRQKIFCGKCLAIDSEETPAVDVMILILDHYKKMNLVCSFRVWLLLYICIYYWVCLSQRSLKNMYTENAQRVTR